MLWSKNNKQKIENVELENAESLIPEDRTRRDFLAGSLFTILGASNIFNWADHQRILQKNNNFYTDKVSGTGSLQVNGSVYKIASRDTLTDDSTEIPSARVIKTYIDTSIARINTDGLVNTGVTSTAQTLDVTSVQSDITANSQQIQSLQTQINKLKNTTIITTNSNSSQIPTHEPVTSTDNSILVGGDSGQDLSVNFSNVSLAAAINFFNQQYTQAEDLLQALSSRAVVDGLSLGSGKSVIYSNVNNVLGFRSFTSSDNTVDISENGDSLDFKVNVSSAGFVANNTNSINLDLSGASLTANVNLNSSNNFIQENSGGIYVTPSSDQNNQIAFGTDGNLLVKKVVEKAEYFLNLTTGNIINFSGMPLTDSEINVYRNGQRLLKNIDYIIAGQTITFGDFFGKSSGADNTENIIVKYLTQI